MTVIWQAPPRDAVSGVSLRSAPGKEPSPNDDFVRVLRARGGSNSGYGGNAAGTSRAEAFNEHGIFQGPVREARVETEGSAQQRRGSGSADRQKQFRDASRPEAADRNAAETEAPGLKEMETAGSIYGRPPTGVNNKAVVPSVQRIAVGDKLSGEAAGSTDRVARVPASGRWLRGGAGATLDIRVAIEALKNGIRVIVRLGSLDLEEHAELRDRISELLARHGYAPAAVRLNGTERTTSMTQDGQDTWR